MFFKKVQDKSCYFVKENFVSDFSFYAFEKNNLNLYGNDGTKNILKKSFFSDQFNPEFFIRDSEAFEYGVFTVNSGGFLNFWQETKKDLKNNMGLFFSD